MTESSLISDLSWPPSICNNPYHLDSVDTDFPYAGFLLDSPLAFCALCDNPDYAELSMEDEAQINEADGGSIPKNAEGVFATSCNVPERSEEILGGSPTIESRIPNPTTSASYIQHHTATSGEGQVASKIEETTPPAALANGYAAPTDQRLMTLSDFQGDHALFSEDDPFAQTFDPSQVDDNESLAPSEVNTIQAFAKLEFDDGEFYMTTYAVELGRDVRAAHREAHPQDSSQPLDPSVRRSRKRSRGSDISGKSRKRQREHKKYSGSVISESGGVIGVDPPNEERGKTPNSTRDKAISSSSSSLRLSRRSSIYAPKKDYNLLTLELAEWMDQRAETDTVNPTAPLHSDQMPSVDKVPLIPIHPPAKADGSAEGHQGISRKHIRIFFNFEKHTFQVIFWGRNGGFVDDEWYATGEIVTLVSGSVIQLKGICIRFTLPNVPEGETGAEEAEHSEGLNGRIADYDMANTDEPDEMKYPYQFEDGTGIAESEELDDQSEGESPPRKREGRLRREPEPEDEAPKPKRKGPGRPPKNGVMSKREQAQQAREAREKVKLKAKGKSNPLQGRGKGKTAKALELEASRLQPNGKRKYTKRKKPVEAEEAQKIRESTEQDDSVPPEAATKPVKDKKPIKPPRSPSPVFNEAELTPEQLTKPSSSYVVLIHEALSNSKTGQMSLPQIYRAIERRYPWFKLRVTTQGWQSSVRHNLSQHAAFTKITRDGKGWMWGLVPEVSIEKEKKRRPTPPPAPQQNYQYPPQAPRYPQHTHSYPYPTVAASAPGTMPFPYSVPPMPYPPRIGANGIPIPFVQPQAESTYKSPYDSNPDPAPAATSSAPYAAMTSNGMNGHYQTATSQPQQQQAPAPAPNGTQTPPKTQTGVHRYSDEFLSIINSFKMQLIKSLNPETNPERLVSSVINHKLYGASLNAEEGSDERLILTALENIILAGEGKQRSAENAPAHSVKTVAEKAADIARKIQDDKSVGEGK